ncbi:hypothetical protein H0262_02810 [Psychrobacter cryohalolentis]|uniref:hypothetical protein n=1 Tax=Psychrobacter sp. D2 TaxID=2759702 RepID=UPI0015E5FB8F|nr:hypothetical protein [Psychrobacter sp. D2]MBA2056811.1 hypothetical protein [Psychrobacter sp. D2]
MAASRSTTRTASQSYRRQALIWLIATLMLGVTTALVWMFSQTPAMGAKIENAPIAAPKTLSAELEQPLKIESLHELDTDVQPISFDETVRDLRSYPDEFKDKRYLLANKGKWTVQVMNVAENEVIVSYLEGREDRSKFTYFRYLDENEQVRYMLTYGLMGSPQEAVGAAKLIDFKLPANVRVLPEEINRYVSIIDNYERPDPVKDLSTKRTRAVNLRPTKREVPLRQKTPTVNNSEQAASNAINRTPQESTNSSATESIRQSVDTSDTLTVNEERIFGTEEQSPTTSASKNTDNNRKPEQESKKPVVSGADTNSAKKPPVVATPKAPNNTANPNSTNLDNKNSSASSANKNANNNSNNAAAPKAKNDSIKELIEEKKD